MSKYDTLDKALIDHLANDVWLPMIRDKMEGGTTSFVTAREQAMVKISGFLYAAAAPRDSGMLRHRSSNVLLANTLLSASLDKAIGAYAAENNMSSDFAKEMFETKFRLEEIDALLHRPKPSDIVELKGSTHQPLQGSQPNKPLGPDHSNPLARVGSEAQISLRSDDNKTQKGQNTR